MSRITIIPTSIVIFAALMIFSGCCRNDQSLAIEPFDNSAAVDAYYAANPEFYTFATLDDLPTDLNWENGEHLPDIGSPEATKGGIYRGRVQDFPRTLRTVGPEANSSFRPYLLDDILMAFAHFHPNIEGVQQHYPGVAKEWAVDLPNRTVYLRIHPDARWSDGYPVTVDDAFFIFYFYQSPHIRDPWYNNFYGINENYENITRYDERTFSVRLKEARPDLADRVLRLRAMPRHFFRELGEDYVERYQWRVMPTTGAYTISEDEIERIRFNRDRISITRVKDWWSKDRKFWRYRFNADEIRLRIIRDTPKAFEAFLLGQLDIFGMNLAEYYYEMLPNHHPMVENGYIHKTTFYNDIPRPTFGLWINSGRPLLNNNDIRKGIHYASNWQLVIDQYFRGDYVRMNTTADGYGYMTHPDLLARPFDPDKAREYFARAGFNRSGSDGILVNESGQRLSFTLSTGYEALRGVVSILREEARKAGLDLRIEILDASANWLKVQEKNHDIAFSAFNVSVEMYPRYWETYHSVNAYDVPFLEDGVTPNPNRRPKTQTNNLELIAIPELDALIEKYDNSSDLEEMRKLAFEMEEIMHEYASFVPGFVMPFYRLAYWRWVRWPDDFNTRLSRDSTEHFVYWLDPELREETEFARRPGSWLARIFPFISDIDRTVFDKSIHKFDQWRVTRDDDDLPEGESGS